MFMEKVVHHNAIVQAHTLVAAEANSLHRRRPTAVTSAVPKTGWSAINVTMCDRRSALSLNIYTYTLSIVNAFDERNI